MTTMTWSGLGSPAASPVCSARGCSGAPDEDEEDEDEEDEAAGCVAPEEHAASRVRVAARTVTPTRLSLIGPVSPNLRGGRHPIAPRERRERRRPTRERETGRRPTGRALPGGSVPAGRLRMRPGAARRAVPPVDVDQAGVDLAVAVGRLADTGAGPGGVEELRDAVGGARLV